MTVQDEPQFALVPSETDKMILAGQLANEKAASDVFADHMKVDTFGTSDFVTAKGQEKSHF